MIYFFDIDLKLKKIVNPDNALSAIHENELNNHIIGSMVMDMSYAKAFIDDVDHFGYYYKGNFYLHRIRRVEDSHIDETVAVTGRHIFFEDMLYGLPIDDFRPQNRDAAYILKNTIDTNTRWHTVMTDVTGVLSTNFYRQVPWDVIEWVTENFRVEFEPVILFDGQKINGYQLHVANKLGVNKHKRIPFSRVTELDYEIDYSEIITSLAGYGKGEEVGEGYGRRINIADVDFSRNGVVSPIGSHYMEDANITALYGKDNGEPKYGIVEFPDIEDDELLAEAMYESYLEMSRPKMAFSASVIDVGDVGIGDTQVIVRPKYDVFYSVRIHKMVVNLHDPEDADVELGDYEHFKESKVERKSRLADKAWKKRYASAIEQMERDWYADYAGVIEQIEQGYEQAVIDSNANIQASEVRMQEELDAQRQAMINNIEQAEQNAIQTAEQNAEAKKQEVQSNLDSFKTVHQQMYDAVTADIMDIDEFLGPKDKTLQLILDEQRQSLEQKIEVYNRNYPNLVVGSTLENIDGFQAFNASTSIELRKDESLNFIRAYGVGDITAFQYPETVYLEQGNTYTIGIDFRSDVVDDLDYIYFLYKGTSVPLRPMSQARGLTADGQWHRYYFTFLWEDTTRNADLLIGTDYRYGNDVDKGWFDTRQVHIYQGDTHNIPWTPSPSDNAQVVSQLLFEMRQLEDGMSTLATKTELDLLTGEVEQFTNEFTSTSEQLSSKLQQYDDALGVNGSHFTQIADQVQSKAWLNDVADINPNLIPFADTSSVENASQWSQFSTSYTTVSVDEFGEFHVRNDSGEYVALQSEVFEVRTGQHTLSFIGRTSVPWNVSGLFNYTYLLNENGSNIYLGNPDKTNTVDSTRVLYTWHFDVPFSGQVRVLIGSTKSQGGELGRFSFTEPKLERGTERTPFLNAFSNVEQLANSLKLQVQELDGTFLSQSDIQIKAGYVQLGSQRLGDEEFASIFRVSPQTIDVVTEQMRLSGDLYVDGDIEALALSAIDANFARVQTAVLKSNVITSDMIGSNVIRAEHIFVQNAMIEDIVNTNLFTDNVKAMSIDAIYADLRSVNSEIMTTNILNSNWLKVDTALIERIVLTEAFIDRAVIKAANVRDLQAITVDAVQANLTTIMNSMGQVEGGLTIRRPDGAVWVQNGQARGHTPVQLFDSYSDAEVGFTGLNWYTQSSHWKTFKYFYTPHEGSRLRITWAVDLYDGPSNIEYMEVRVRTFTDYKPINMGSGTSSRRVTLNKSEGTVYVTQDIPMPPPNYNMMAAYLEFRRAPDGQSINNRVQARILHIGQYE